MINTLGVAGHMEFWSHRPLRLFEQTFKHIKTTLNPGLDRVGWGWGGLAGCLRLTLSRPSLSWKGLQSGSTHGIPSTRLLPNSQALPLQQGQVSGETAGVSQGFSDTQTQSGLEMEMEMEMYEQRERFLLRNWLTGLWFPA